MNVEKNPPDSTRFIAFDTETTGLSPVSDRIIEVAAIAFGRDGAETASFERLIDPGMAIPPQLTAIHGISDDMVAGKPRIEQVLPEFLKFVAGGVLVAHNAPYDVSMMLVPLRRMAVPPPDNLVLDTCTLARAVFPGAPNYRLGTVAELLGIARGRAHRAMSDVATCKELFLRILAKCPPDAPLADLVRLNGSELRLGGDDAGLADLGLPDGRVALLRGAMRSATPVMIEYQGGSKGSGPRLVTPITVIAQGRSRSLLAHCHVDGGLKNFRLSLISAVYPLPTS